MPRFFEDICVNDETVLASVHITREMRDQHVKIYGEDWQEEILERMQREGVLPAPLVLSLIAGQMGASCFIHIEFLREFHLVCEHPIRVGDTISTKVKVLTKRAHQEPSKDFGYVTVEQIVTNQNGITCVRRTPTYTVPLRVKRQDNTSLHADVRPVDEVAVDPERKI